MQVHPQKGTSAGRGGAGKNSLISHGTPTRKKNIPRTLSGTGDISCEA